MSSDREPGEIVVIGVGNSWGGDDALGPRVIESLDGRAPEGVRLRSHEGEPTSLLDLWDGAAVAILVDAVASGGEPGEISRFDASREPLPSSFSGSSTHAFSVAQAIELGRALGRLPERVIVIGVEGRGFDGGTALTAPVASSVEPATRAVLAELGAG